MKDHEGDLKQYILLSEAYYAESELQAMRNKDVKDEVTFGFYSPEGEAKSELSVRWHELGRKPIWGDGALQWVPRISPKLSAFNDAWQALAELRDVIDAMAEVDSEDITPKEFCQLLERCGFEDRTPRERDE